MTDKCNFGGFVAISTVDLPGRAACTVFFRGCPNHCPRCHNPKLLGGTNLRPIKDVIEMIDGAKLAVSAVVFSGGEPTSQPGALGKLLFYSKQQGLYTAIHTSGVNYLPLATLIGDGMVDKVFLDIKTTWDRYPALLGNDRALAVEATLNYCRSAHEHNLLPDFEIIHTVFRDSYDIIPEISDYAPDNALVLQQGNEEDGASPTPEKLRELALSCVSPGRRVSIRTRQKGEELIS